jgi:NADH-quinone oxidoreductase E subunit
LHFTLFEQGGLNLKDKDCSCKSCGTKNGYAQIVQGFEKSKDSIIPALHEIQAKLGYLPEAAMEELAEWLEVPVSDVYGTATFYTLFSTKPKGRYIIRLCDSAPCHLEGSKSIKSAIARELGVQPGETTPEGDFTFEIVSCFGLCGVAPAVMINEDVYGNLTPEMIPDIFGKYRNKES